MSNVLRTYPGGSRWRQWDLHVHTPASIVNAHYGQPKEVAWDAFFRDLEALPANIKVVGICDYWFLEGYQRVLDYRAQGHLSNLECILPVVELRVDKFAGTDADMSKVNLHVVFSEALTPKTIQEQFLGHLKIHREFQGREPPVSGYITPDLIKKLGEAVIRSAPKDKPPIGSPLEVGFNATCIPMDNVYEQLQSSTLLTDKRGNRLYMTVLGRNEWNAVRWDGQGGAEKITMAKRADLFFGAAQTLEEARNAQSGLLQSVKGRYLHCSDAHYPLGSTEPNHLGHCFTWIKADPTFEGLRQVLLDYEDRLRISDTNPTAEHPRQYFSTLTLPDATVLTDEQTNWSVKFKGQCVPLNPYLVTIIGGRGSGKSLLLRALSACCTTNPGEAQRQEPEISAQCDVQLGFTQPTGETATLSIIQPGHVDFLYVGQGDVKREVESPRTLSGSLNRLLGLEERVVGASLDTDILAKLADFSQIESRAYYFDGTGKKSTSKEHYESLQEDASARINSLKTAKTQELIDKLTESLTAAKNVDTAEEAINQLLESVNSIEKDLSSEAKRINGLCPAAKVPPLDLGTYRQELAASQLRCQSESAEFQKTITLIRETFSGLGLSGDPEESLKLISQHQKTVEDCNTKLKVLEADQRHLAVWRGELPGIADSLRNEIEERKSEIEQAWTQVKAGSASWSEEQRQTLTSLLEGIEVHASAEFLASAFSESLSDCFNGRKFRKAGDTPQAERIRQSLGLSDLNSFLKLIADTSQVQLPDEDGRLSLSDFVARTEYFSVNGQDKLLKALLTSEPRDSYLKVIPTILFDGKSLSALSIGQRGTLFVAIKLATSAFGVPFVYDQPEDDLDNKFISERLVPILRKIKQYRQVIIVTHNGNLVVNADAEQVVVAANCPVGTCEEVSYCSGALESDGLEAASNEPRVVPDIRLQACNILEGGTEAFQQRERRYGLFADS